MISIYFWNANNISNFKPFAIKDARKFRVKQIGIKSNMWNGRGIALYIDSFYLKLCVLTFGLFAIDTSALIALLPKPISVFGREINALSTDAKLFPSPAI